MHRGAARRSLTRCLVDTAATERETVVEQAVREAEFLRMLDTPGLTAASWDRRGGALLRRLAQERLPVRGELREELERRFATFLLDRRLPAAVVNQSLRLERPRQHVVLDVVWWEAALAAELDSRQAHLTARAIAADRERDRRLAVQHGLQVVRITWRQLHDDPDALERDLRALHARGLARRSGAAAG